MQCFQRWAIVGVTIFLIIALYVYWQLPSSPEEALNNFYSGELAEGELVDSLILGGKKIVPLLLEKIRDKDMLQRRYAIAALGHLDDTSAVPVLESILEDVSEMDHFRCDALEAIAILNTSAGRAFAKDNVDSSISCIRELSQSIAAGNLPNRRSYLQIFFGWHL